MDGITEWLPFVNGLGVVGVVILVGRMMWTGAWVPRNLVEDRLTDAQQRIEDRDKRIEDKDRIIANMEEAGRERDDQFKMLVDSIPRIADSVELTVSIMKAVQKRVQETTPPPPPEAGG